MPLDARNVARVITEPQRQCILSLSEDWKMGGYSTVYADMLWALGGSRLTPDLPEMVDQKVVREPGVYTRYAHRLLPAGVAVQKCLQSQCSC